MPFLTAHWKNLILLTYPVPPALLHPYLPPNLTLDLHNHQPHLSLVAFDFLQTKVLNIPWPGYRNFPEINLRFYVRHHNDRGVVFIREFVPKKLVAAIARKIYNEPYRAAPMTSRVVETKTQITVEHRLTFAGRQHRLSVTAAKPATFPAEDSTEHFFREHQWGFGQSKSKKCTRYQVSHPHWPCYPILSHHLDWDFASVYGQQFAFLNTATPTSIILAAGSPISVFPKGKIPKN